MEYNYPNMLAHVLGFILDRYERDPDYHFIDTKLSLITGEDFDEHDPVRGKQTIYPWIQGRGLEALVGHIKWLQGTPGIDRQEADQLIDRSFKVLKEVFAQMETLRNGNGGRLYFMMTPQGQALRIDESGAIVPHGLRADSPSSFSDLFYVKGMAATAELLKQEEKRAESMQWFKRIGEDILERRFASDQQQLDPKNTAAKKIEGRHAQGPYMIALGAVALLIKCGGDAEIKEIGFRLIDHILDHHIHLDGNSSLSHLYDMWEFIDSDGNPFLDEGKILLSDPGHACEFVGLALSMIAAIEKHQIPSAEEKKKIAEYKRVLPEILKQNFANGFSEKGFGIVKAFDLVSRTAINTDMPWWSLPETMRAANLVLPLVSSDEAKPFEQIIFQCSEAFISHYIKPELAFMAIQTLDKNGQPINAIPATPDADPGYHTGLSIIDYLKFFT